MSGEKIEKKKISPSLIGAVIVIIILLAALVYYATLPPKVEVVPTTIVSTITVTSEVKPYEIKIGVIGKSLSPWWTIAKAGAEYAGKVLKIHVDFFAPTKEDVPAQLDAFDSYLAKGYDAIAFACSDPKASITYINKAIEKGVPVITYNSDSPESKRLCFVGISDYEGGKAAGELMIKALQEKGIPIKGSKFGIGQGSATALNAIERARGFADVIKAAGGIVLEPVIDKEDPEKALELATTLLTTHPDIVGVFGTYSYNGKAFSEAVKQLDLVGKVIIVQFDTLKQNIDPIAEGVAYGTIGQRQFFQAFHAVRLLYNIVINKRYFNDLNRAIEVTLQSEIIGYPESKWYPIGFDEVTVNNLKEVALLYDKLGMPRDWKYPGES
ncbi:MAG: substrate-binding domain-containing protein [Candidatus Methanomethylicaceae archaeon]